VDDAQHIEEIIVRCGLMPARVGAALVSLELTGHARQLEGQRWAAVGARSGRR
jgi:predicted Rossmann fold nucleotide-binding protein DprA/Smf involved in DNA uptake